MPFPIGDDFGGYMGLHSNAYNITPRKRGEGNTNAARPERTIDLGWIHMGAQVRRKNGGGVRKIKLSKQATKNDILQVAKDTFFPAGISSVGLMHDFAFDVTDFKEASIPYDMNLAELYKWAKQNILRIYLRTSPKIDNALQ